MCSLFLNLFDDSRTLSLISFDSNCTITEIGLLVEPLQICFLVVIRLSFFILTDLSICSNTLSNSSTSSCTRAFFVRVTKEFYSTDNQVFGDVCVWSVQPALINDAFNADPGFATFVARVSIL